MIQTAEIIDYVYMQTDTCIDREEAITTFGEWFNISRGLTFWVLLL